MGSARIYRLHQLGDLPGLIDLITGKTAKRMEKREQQ